MYRDCTSFHWGAKEAIQHAVDLFPPEQNPLYPSFYMDYNCVVRSLRLLPEKQEHDKESYICIIFRFPRNCTYRPVVNKCRYSIGINHPDFAEVCIYHFLVASNIVIIKRKLDIIVRNYVVFMFWLFT